MRRVFDVLVAIVGGLVLLPVMLVVGIAVLVTFGRPILFLQERSGLWGELFTVVKFRTMFPPRRADDADPDRTPWLGRMLRASSLDELPQLWNVLRGEMSLIGPRPTLPEQVARYTHHERGSLEVRPGLTGWAQVNGRNTISWPEQIELGRWYIAHRSVRLDLNIPWLNALRLLQTRGVIGEGGVNPGFPGPSIVPITSAQRPTPPPYVRSDATSATDAERV
jgi:lipopolysaccharide/colanic/teichoic acid biosynthesis glycosyltransferase